MSTQADVEQMKVFCAFRCETRSDDQRGHTAERAKVKGQSAVVVCVGESTGAVAAGVFLKWKKKSLHVCYIGLQLELQLRSLVWTLLLMLPGPHAIHASFP